MSSADGVCLTARLRLEPVGPEHAEDLVRLFQDPLVAKWYGGTWNPADAKSFAELAQRAWARDGVHKWMAYRRSDGALVGRGGLSRMALDARTTVQITGLTAGTNWSRWRLELGWALLSGFHGQGYATEIGREGLLFARHAFSAESVIAFTERPNLASRRVMERLSMTYVGEITWRGLVEGQAGEADDAPFAVYLKQIAHFG
ncbi:MAG TPA: GNAT family N-acetyltransferase [Acidimicrobiales bacterium]|nr:GNAT family N-acetyltransferase [Acidimicrobiales bacterium]